MIAASVAGLGFIAELISKPTMIGYLNGLALTILIGQLPKLLGFKVEADGLIDECAGFVEGLAEGKTVATAAMIGISGVVLVLILQRWLPKVPAVLVMVVAAIAVTKFFDLGERVDTVGVLPEGFPPLTIPDISPDDLGLLFAGALGIALVSLADTISTASAFAARTGQEVHGNQEMAGIGAANLAAGLFQGFPVSTSGSRTAVAERSGAKTQLTGVVGAALIILVLVLLPGLFADLPQPALAAVVITASLSLADIPATVRLWRQRRSECLLSVSAFLGVALLGVLPGIAIAVGLSILNVFRRAWRPYDAVLGRVDGLEGYHDIRFHPEAEQLPGLVLYRFDAPLVFANAKTFRDEVLRFSRTDPAPIWIVIAAEPVTDIDTTAFDVLVELEETLNALGISLVFAELKDPVRRKFEHYGLNRTIDPRRFFPTIEAAVTAFGDQTGASWIRLSTRRGGGFRRGGDDAGEPLEGLDRGEVGEPDVKAVDSLGVQPAEVGAQFRRRADDDALADPAAAEAPLDERGHRRAVAFLRYQRDHRLDGDARPTSVATELFEAAELVDGKVPPVGVGADELEGAPPDSTDRDRDLRAGDGPLAGARQREVLAVVIDGLARPQCP
jgi:MFS superfamily sulfate permease-like transporter